MRKLILILLLLLVLAEAQDFIFQQEFHTIPVIVDGRELPEPWLGGYSITAPEFYDLDADGDLDLLEGAAVDRFDYYLNQVFRKRRHHL